MTNWVGVLPAERKGEAEGAALGRKGITLRLIVLGLVILTVPLGIRAVNRFHPADVKAEPSYLPALEGPRVRDPFDPVPIGDLAAMNPGYVVIGDSMAGTRIDPKRLIELSGAQVAPLLHAGSGSAWWYLVLKNWVIASKIKPRCVFIFFRDTNLTNVMFRLDDAYRWMVDFVARDREDELNGVIASALEGPWHRIDHAVERAYGADVGREWLDTAFTTKVGSFVSRDPRQYAVLLKGMNDRFGLDHLRPMTASDAQAATDREADFSRYVNRSLLPLMLRDANAAGLKLCFVRVQRRPVGGKPPYQSPAMRRYIADLKAYVESRGGLFHDDTGDSALTLDMYEDGDHIAKWARRIYTGIFFARLKPVFQP